VHRKANSYGGDDNKNDDEADPAFLSGGAGRIDGLFSMLITRKTVSSVRDHELSQLTQPRCPAQRCRLVSESC
jgi:hypothetical protein